jgi:hypothetical protein
LVVATQNMPMAILVIPHGGDLFIQAATYAAQGATDGTKTVQLFGVDAVGTFAITNILTVSGLAALARTAFVMATTNRKLLNGGLVYAAYVVGTAGTIAPGETAITLDVQEPIGEHFGPAWAG